MGWETSAPIVVPIDFSGMSVKAVGEALKLAKSKTQLHAVHVVPTLDQIIPNIESEWNLPSDSDRRASVQKHFSTFLEEHNFTGLRTVILDGQPGPQIAEYAEEIGAGLIVIPSHGYHGMKRILLGSVAEKVVQLATCPVFIVRRQDAE